MIKYSIIIQNGKVTSEMNGGMVKKSEALGFFKCVGLSMGNLLKSIPHDVAMACIDALMDGMEEAKQEKDN